MNIKSLTSYALALTLGLAAAVAQAAETYLPFVLASNEAGTIADKLEGTKKALQDNGFEIAGEYSPFAGAHIVVVTNAELKKEAASHDRGGYIAAQRISLTEMGGKTQISYTNPFYMAKAYFIKGNLAATSSALKKALGYVQDFGPEEGLTERKLGKYHYTFGMEYFDEPLELATAGSHDKLVQTIEKNLSAKKNGASKVYRIDIPGTNQTLFGVGMKAPDEGKKYMDETFIMSEIDFKPLRSTAHLPYEILVKGSEAEALHARFRIAINFPDLSMMGDNSFMNIMPTPDAIKEVLMNVAGGKKDVEEW
ncbi:MAG: hypothetical protein OQL06_05505 [Gammaproteobacteria bacterium]|nr:hypothetical protein [Gammaproteobacteria bacterium]